MSTRPLVVWTCLLAMPLVHSCRVLAQGEARRREYAIKCQYVGQFGNFVTWPAGALGKPEDPFVIGVLGPDPFGEELDILAKNKRVADGRQVVARRFATIDEYRRCHILFVSREEGQGGAKAAEERLQAALKRTKGQPVLLVADTPSLAKQGAIINFFIEENFVRLEINLGAAKRAGLDIDARVLALEGTRVIDNNKGE